MTINIVSTDLTTQQFLNARDTLVLLRDASITETSGAAITSGSAFTTNVDIQISGEVVGSTGGIQFFTTVDATFGDNRGDYSIGIGKTGTVSATNGTAVLLAGVNNSVTNFGEITALSSAASGLEIFDSDFSVRNFGLISGGKGLGLGLSEDPFAVVSGFVENAGEILGEGQGILSRADLILSNSGSIIASDGDGASSAVLFSSLLDAVGIGSTVNNSGFISGQGISVEFTDKDDVLNNQGVLVGDVEFNGGADVFNGLGGSIIGTVFGGAGDDSFTINDALINLVEFADEGADSVRAAVTWTLGDNFEDLRLIGGDAINGKGNTADNLIAGNASDNRLFGFEGDDFVDGNGGDDRIFGGLGVDFLDGGTGNDRLFGGKDADGLVGDSGDDRLAGGSDNDKLSGGAGGDGLFGNQGKDSLNGGNGQDRLIGGRDKDILRGGDDIDTFVFNRLNHSDLGGKSDRIADFEVGEDRIDLSNLNLDLAFNGNTGFSGVAGEVRAKVGASKTFVLLDSDGDGSADMRIVLNGALGLEASDFVL